MVVLKTEYPKISSENLRYVVVKLSLKSKSRESDSIGISSIRSSSSSSSLFCFPIMQNFMEWLPSLQFLLLPLLFQYFSAFMP